MQPLTSDPPTYRRVLAVPGFARLATATLLSRTGNQVFAIALVLFVLARYHSPTLAGASVLLLLAPGLAASPVAGALLDRHGRRLLITLDYAMGALASALIPTLAWAGRLDVPVLLVILAAASLTTPLSNSGTRSLYPLIVPRELWDRANAIDSGSFLVSAIVGPAFAGLMVAAVGGEGALLATAALFAGAALVIAAVRDTEVGVAPPGRLLRDAWDGLVYVTRRNPTLRGLALSISLLNIAGGVLNVALPLLVFDRLHMGPAIVGALWAAAGAVGIVAGLLAGRVDSEGRERFFLVAGGMGMAVAMALLAAAGSLPLALAGMALFGMANGPMDIGLFSLRQRATDPAWLGRAFAVSMSLNFTGVPIGSAVAGPVAGRSLGAALWLAAAVAAAASVVPILAIPASDRRR